LNFRRPRLQRRPATIQRSSGACFSTGTRERSFRKSASKPTFRWAFCGAERAFIGRVDMRRQRLAARRSMRSPDKQCQPRRGLDTLASVYLAPSRCSAVQAMPFAWRAPLRRDRRPVGFGCAHSPGSHTRLRTRVPLPDPGCQSRPRTHTAARVVDRVKGDPEVGNCPGKTGRYPAGYGRNGRTR
jgi:hypothetical protein